MVGAKEFAINRKVIARRKPNPLIESIRMPAFMKAHENELKKMPTFDSTAKSGFSLPKLPEKDKGVEDNHYAPRMAKHWDAKTPNPIATDARKDSPRLRLPFLNMPRPNPVEKKPEEPKEESISDDLANQITYKVLKNIKSYLNREKESREMPMGNKHIKLEISL